MSSQASTQNVFVVSLSSFVSPIHSFRVVVAERLTMTEDYRPPPLMLFDGFGGK